MPLSSLHPAPARLRCIARLTALGLLLGFALPLRASDPAPGKIRIRVAGAQIPVGTDIAENVAAITRAIEFAAREKADVLVTPEGSLSGYTPEFDAAATQRALVTVLERARAAKIALVLGTCFQSEDGRRYNAQQFYEADGDYLGFHAKILLCRRMSDPVGKGEVDGFQTRPLRTFQLNGFTVGGLICNDLWANPEWTPMDDPYLARKLSEMGARLLFVSANTGRGIGPERAVSRAFHDANVRMRTRTGKLWSVVVNAGDPESTPDRILHCPSGVMGPDGEWALMVTSPKEQFFAHTIELEARPTLAANR